MLPENENQYDLRNIEKYQVLHAYTDIYMQNLLNIEARNQQQMNETNMSELPAVLLFEGRPTFDLIVLIILHFGQKSYKMSYFFTILSFSFF